MSSATSVNALFKAMGTKHALGSVEAIQVQDQLARTMFGVPLKALSPMQRNAVEMSAMTVVNSGGSNMLGIADGGAVYADIYKGIISSATGISTGDGMSFGHSPQMMSAASSVMQNLNQAMYGKGPLGVGTGGNMKTMGGVLRQYLQRNGLGEGSTRTLSRKGKSFGSFVQSVGTDSGLTETEKKAIVGQELSGAVFDAYTKRIEKLSAAEAKELGIEDLVGRSYASMSEANKRRVEQAIAKQAKKDKEKGTYDKQVRAVKAEKIKEYEAELVAQGVSEDERERKLALFRRSLNKAELGDLDNLANVKAASRASKGENEYTALTKAAAREQKNALRRAAGLTKEMSEIFGTEDADQLLNIAKQFGSKTLTASRDVKNMKRIMDIARTRAAATGRTLTDVMGEMQGIAAVGAQAVGSHGITASYLEHATRQMQASQASRNAGLDYRTDSEVQAEIAEQEQNYQRNMNEGLYALEMMDKDSEEYQYWSKRLKEGNLTPDEIEQFRRMGSAWIAKNEWALDPRKMQDVAQNSSLAAHARKAMAGGALQDHASGNVKDLLATASMDKDSELNQAIEGTFGNSDNASQQMQDVLLAYGGQQKELKDDYKALKRLSAEGREEWIKQKTNQLKQSGASKADIDKAEAAYRALITIADSGANGKVVMRQLHNIQGTDGMNDTVGSIENVKAEARHLQSMRAESMKRSKEAAGSEGAIVGGLNYNDASDEAKMLGLLTEADRSIARTGGVDLIGNKDGAIHVDNINSLKYDDLKDGAKNEMTKYIAENAVAFKTDENGMIDAEHARSVALQLEQDTSAAGQRKLKNLRRALGLKKGESVSAALADMDTATLTRTIYEAENSGTSGVLHGKGGLIVGGTGEEMEKAAEGVKLQNTLKVMGQLSFLATDKGVNKSTNTLSEIGQSVLAGTASEDQLKRARAIIDSGHAGGAQAVMAAFESMGVKNISKKDGVALVTDKNGVSHDITDRKALIGFMSQAAKADPNLQPTLEKLAEEGDTLASDVLIQNKLDVFKPLMASGTSGQAAAETRRRAMQEVVKKMAGDDAEGQKRADEMAADYKRIDQLQAALDSGTLSEEDRQKAEAELKAIDVKHATWTGGLGKDDAFLKANNIQRDKRNIDFASAAIASENAKLGDNAAGKVVAENFIGELSAAQGDSPELMAIREQIALEKQNKTMFDGWNKEFTKCDGSVTDDKSLTLKQSLGVLAGCCRWKSDQWQIYVEL